MINVDGEANQTGFYRWRSASGRNPRDTAFTTLKSLKSQNFGCQLPHGRKYLSTSERRVMVLFSPKYQCELAGLGIEYAWGLAKRFYRRKVKFQDKKKYFAGSVDCALREITVHHCRKFLDRTRRYAMAYLWLDQKDVEHVVIERFVKVFKCLRSAMDQETGYFDKLIADILQNKEC